MGGEARLREGDKVTNAGFESSQNEGPVRGCVGGDLGAELGVRGGVEAGTRGVGVDHARI